MLIMMFFTILLFFTYHIILIAPRGKLPIVFAMLSRLPYMYAGRP